MKIFLKVAAFLAVNAVGFSIGPALYAIIVMKMEAIDYQTFNMETYLTRHGIAWGISMIFSLANFFFRGLFKIVFLSLPVLIPLGVNVFYMMSKM